MPQERVPQVPGPADTDPRRQSGDISLYKYYFKSVGLFLAVIFFLLTAGVAGLGRMPRKSRRRVVFGYLLWSTSLIRTTDPTSTEIWLRIWTEHGTDKDIWLYFSIYLVFAVASVVQTIVTLAFVPLSLPSALDMGYHDDRSGETLT